MRKTLFALVAILILPLSFVMMGCSNNDQNTTKSNPRIIIHTTQGNIIVDLYYNVAPNTVRNFLYLASNGFYDGTIFHRVGPNFMIQGGCPLGTGTGNPGHRIRCETTSNNHPNNIAHERGVLSMAHAGRNTGGSQFFIMTGTATLLNGVHTAFGRVAYGMEYVDAIARQPGVPLDQWGSTFRPSVEQQITGITIETFGHTFDAPDKI